MDLLYRGEVFLTDSGLETDLLYHHGVDLPAFAVFPLLAAPAGRALLTAYFREHLSVAEEGGFGLVLETPTWRASRDWGGALGYGAAALAAVNRDAVALLADLRATATARVLISGCLGPRGDAYRPGELMTAEAAERYHWPQVAALAGADLVSGLTLGYPAEAVGLVRAAQRIDRPVVVSFTVEVDGRLPSGQPLGTAITEVDDRTGRTAAWFMVNCAHPEHIEAAVEPGAAWLERVQAVRVNASLQSHAELDACDVLDDGDPVALAQQVVALRKQLPRLQILGGCCGTDVRHIRELGRALV